MTTLLRKAEQVLVRQGCARLWGTRRASLQQIHHSGGGTEILPTSLTRVQHADIVSAYMWQSMASS
jgi:hypothetical protein